MQDQNEERPKGRKLVTSRSVLLVTAIVIVMTIVSIWLFGLGQHRTLFANSILSTTVLSIAFFSFLTIGLYRGIKLKDDIGKITDNLKRARIPEFPGNIDLSFDPPDVGDGVAGAIVGILLWLIISIFLVIFLTYFGYILWSTILIFAGMLYWIFFRALRLVFKKSNTCKGDLPASIVYGLIYTALYNSWIYAIIVCAHFAAR